MCIRDRIYGDGVNVAARLESLADPGGICISGTVYEQVRDKLALSYEDAGEQAVKNIVRPVRVFRVVSEPGTAAGKITRWSPRRSWRGGAFSLVGLAIIIGTIVLVEHLSLRPPTTTASIPPAQKPSALPLPNIPSIAVLPFTNMSGDPKQEYFGDGITDVLISELSKLNVIVVARNSSFTYKGKAVKVQEVGRELGVKYLLEGGIQKSSNEIRVNVQLVDASTGDQLWAERYDRSMKDIFALQDEIVLRIATTLRLQLTLWEEHGLRISRYGTDNLDAYDYFLRGMEYDWGPGKESILAGAQMFQKAIELDPKFSGAYGALGWMYFRDWAVHSDYFPNALELAYEAEQRAIALSDSNPFAHAQLAVVDVWRGQPEQALAEANRAIALAPNVSMINWFMGSILNTLGRPAEAVDYVEKAVHLDPRLADFFVGVEGNSYLQMGRYADALPLLKRYLASSPDKLPPGMFITMDYMELGQEQNARAAAAAIMRSNPQFSLRILEERSPKSNPVFFDRLFADLRKAGLK